MTPSILPWILVFILHNFIKGVVTIASGNAKYDIEFTTVQVSMEDVLLDIANSTIQEIVEEADRLWDQELQAQLNNNTSEAPLLDTTLEEILPRETFHTNESSTTKTTMKAMFSLWLNKTTKSTKNLDNVTDINQVFVNSSQDVSTTETYTGSPSSWNGTPTVQHTDILHNDTSTTAPDSLTSIISDTIYSDKMEAIDTGGNRTETSAATTVTSPGGIGTQGTDSGKIGIQEQGTDSGKIGIQEHATSQGATVKTTQGIPRYTMFMIAVVLSITATVGLFALSACICCKIRRRYVQRVYTIKEKYCMHNLTLDIKEIESSTDITVKTDAINLEGKTV
jgi:hypothetical protein